MIKGFLTDIASPVVFFTTVITFLAYRIQNSQYLKHL